MPVDLPVITGKTDYQVEQAVYRLREAIEALQAQNDTLRARVDGMPPGLTLEEIQEALSPTGSHPLPTAALLNTNPPPTNPEDTLPDPIVQDGIPDHLDIVQSVHASMGITGASSDEQVWRFLQTVVEEINNSGTDPVGLVCGYTDAPPAGEGVFTCAGETYRYGRVCYSNGHLFDILIDADPGGARTPQWADNGMAPELYRPATSPTSPC